MDIGLGAGTVRVRDTGAVAGGPTLLFVHGLACDGRLWDPVVERVRGWARCVVPDLPLGSHEIAMRPDADLAPPALAGLIAELIERMDLADPILVGNDTGGALSQLVAAHHPGRIGGLVLTSCDAFGNFLPKYFKHLQVIARIPGGTTAFLAPTRVKALHGTPLVYGLLARKPIPAELTASWLAPARTRADIRRDLTKVVRGISKRQTLEAAERLRGFDKPALVVWDDTGRVFPESDGRRLAERLPQGRFELIADSGVYLPLDQPERLAEHLEAFARQAVAA